MRQTSSGVVHILAGCRVCNGADAMWTAKNALAVAARHHDATGHPTWCEQVISTRYGPAEMVNGGGEQPDLFAEGG